MISNNYQMFRNLTECNYSYIQLIDFNARFYSPSLGRFIQPDTLIPNPTNPQSLNRFSYALNNPVKYSDPSGHMFISQPGSGPCFGGSCRYSPPGDIELSDEDLEKIRLDGNLDEWGEKMIDVYKNYRDTDGWWNEDGDFTVIDFLAFALHVEYDFGPGRSSLYTNFGLSAKYKIMHIGSWYDDHANFDVYAAVFIYIGGRESMRLRSNGIPSPEKSDENNVGGYKTWQDLAEESYPSVIDFAQWNPVIYWNVPFEFKNYAYYTDEGQIKLANALIGTRTYQKFDSTSYWQQYEDALVILSYFQNEYWEQYKK